MKTVKRLIALLLSAPVFVCLSASAQTLPDTIKTGKTNDPMVIKPGHPADEMNVKPAVPNDRMAVMTDTGFINKNIADNAMELELAKLGRKHATSAAAKKAAEVLITDHTALLQNFKALAAKKQTGAADSNYNKPALPALKNTTGFDAKWASAMLTMHQAKRAELEQFISASGDADIQATARKALPKIIGHIEMLSRIPGAKLNDDPNTLVH